MIELDKFLPRIATRVPGAARPVMYEAIRIAAEKFCERTKLWRCNDSINLTGEAVEYPVAPGGAVIYEIESARDELAPLRPVTRDWLEDQFAIDWRTMTGSRPLYVTQTDMDTVQLVPIADSGTVTLELILKPAPDATQLPDFIYDHYSQVIADGALAELFTMPGQDYTSPELASFHGQRFLLKLDSLMLRGKKGQQRARLRTKANFI